MSNDVRITLSGDPRGAIRSTREVRESVGGLNTAVKGLVRELGILAAAYISVSKGVEVFKKGIDAVEEAKIGVAGLSALTLTFMETAGRSDLAEMWEEANGYARDLYETVEDLSAETLLSGQQANLMVQEFIKGRQAIKLGNEEQVSGLKSIANSLFIVTGGLDLERQIITEIGHLLLGNITAQDRLGKLLGTIDPKLKEHLKTWIAEGTVIENVGKLLKGFDPATKDLAGTLQAIKSALDTVANQILRGAMKPVYEDIVGLLLRGKKYLVEHKEIIQDEIYKTYLAIKGLLGGIGNILESLSEPLGFIGRILGTIVEGWRLILVILPAITKRVGDFFKSIWDVLRAVGHVGEALWKVMNLDFRGAAASVDKAKAAWMESGRHVGDAFAGGFLDEVEGRLREYYAGIERGEKGGAKTPKFGAPPPDEETLKKIAEARAWLRDRLNQLTLDEFDYRRTKLLEEYSEVAKVIGWTEDLWRSFKLDLARIDEEQARASIEAYREFHDRVNQLTLDEFDYRRVKLLEWYSEQAQIIGWTFALWNAFNLDLGKLNKEEAEKEKQNRIEAFETIKQFSEDYHLFRLEQLDYLEEFLRSQGISEIAISRWKSEELKKGAMEDARYQIEHAESLGDALGAKSKLMALETKSTFERMADAIGDVFDALERSLSDLFFDPLNFKLAELGNAIRRIMADLVASEIMGSVRNWLGLNFHGGGPVMHAGGLVMHAGGPVPRFHTGGLSSDEVPAILQRGEYVVSRRGVEALDKINEGEFSSGPPVINYFSIQAWDKHDIWRFIMKNREVFGAAAASLVKDNYQVGRRR